MSDNDFDGDGYGCDVEGDPQLDQPFYQTPKRVFNPQPDADEKARERKARYGV